MTWRNIIALGCVASAAVVGCTVTTSSDKSDGGSGGGGTADSATGGTSAADGSTGGKATGGGGAAATGGSSGAGGASGASTGGNAPTDAATPLLDAKDVCTAERGDNDCMKCLKTKCCIPFTDCANDPDCGQSSTSKGDLICIQDCMLNTAADGGTPDIGTCAGNCGGATAPATTEILTCIREIHDGSALQNCSTACFGVEL